MRDAETILNIIRERGSRKLPLENIYRQLYNRNLYLYAYARIYANDGAMTPGATDETVDGMSIAKIDALIEELRYERFRWTPVRRKHIPKKNSNAKRPLGLPTWTDKLLQEVIRMILEAYYEPQFSSLSHGFRPKRGCHTALQEIRRKWTGTVWFIEGDITQCFDRIDHQVLTAILGEKLHDNRFLRLIGNLLQAGYLEDWQYHKTLSGTPQGGVVSPILSNIYLDRLDQFVEQKLLPLHNRGDKRKRNSEQQSLRKRARRREKAGKFEEAKRLRQQAQELPSGDPNDPNFRRLRYVRYADDILLSFAGPRIEAEEIKQQLAHFLREELKLELSERKTLITHARTEAARFLGYEIRTRHQNAKRDKDGRRCINGQIRLQVPIDVVKAKCRFYMRNGKPIHRSERIFDSDYSIVAQYQAEFRGIVEYYRLAENLYRFSILKWMMERSLVMTLAAKHRTRVSRIYRKYKTVIKTDEGYYKVLKVVVPRGDEKPPLVAYWGGISLRRKLDAVLDDQPATNFNQRSELLQRLLANTCELCGSTDNIEVHHIRRLSSLKKKGRKEPQSWAKLMARRRRKTLVVCRQCHWDIHTGRSIEQKNSK